jgi:hypothetical protein
MFYRNEAFLKEYFQLPNGISSLNKSCVSPNILNMFGVKLLMKKAGMVRENSMS